MGKDMDMGWVYQEAYENTRNDSNRCSLLEPSLGRLSSSWDLG